MKADRNPWGALADLEKAVAESKRFLYSDHYAAMFTAWAQRDPEGAIEALHSIKNGALHRAVGAVLDVAFEQDPTRAAEVLKEWQHLDILPMWLREHPIEACRLVPEIAANQDGADHFSFSAAWAETDPSAALTWANSLAGWARTTAIEDVIKTWAKDDLDGAIKAYETGQIVDWKTRSMFKEQIAIELGETDPVGAIDWYLSPGSSRSEASGIRPIIEAWARRDFTAALGWTLDQQDSVRQEVGFRAILPHWLSVDVSTVAEFVMSSNLPVRADRVPLEKIGLAYVAADPAAGLDWVDQLPASVRPSIEARAFADLFERDRVTAVAELGSRLKRVSTSTVRRFATDYVKADPEAATAWLTTLPKGLARNTATESFR
ncbi:MAG: hypothetical protein KDN22_14800 [Verrucomicrobiae bacterium]|nr:hypothetical protein [Verrucomicrobiae bacterium]